MPELVIRGGTVIDADGEWDRIDWRRRWWWWWW